MPGQRAVARMISAFVVGGDRADTFSTCGWRWRSPAAGGIRCQAPRRERRTGSIKRQEVPKRLSRCCPSPARPEGSPISPAREHGWGRAGGRQALGSTDPALSWGFRGLGWLLQPGGLGQCRQRWVGTGQGACFSSLSKCGLAAVGPAGRQHMIPAAWG